MPVTRENVHDVIEYHKPTDEELARIAEVRVQAEGLIRVILANAPSCADQQAAIRHVREAMMTANAAIVLRGAV